MVIGIRAAALVLCGAATVCAQRTEFGGMAGGGAFAVASGGAAGAGQFGVEACLFCPGRLAVFAEYSHWVTAGAGAFSDRVRNADVAGGGLRIQWREHVRPFLDIGVAGGLDQHSEGGGGGIGGIALGAGVRIPVGEHWYVRPQFRIYCLSPHSVEGLSVHVAEAFSVGVGYRF